MASKEPQGVPTYPVWVGSLKETVKENDLKRVFSKLGAGTAIASYKVMRDPQGRSRKFGYVNYYKKADAEKAARQAAGASIHGVQIQTKGPSVLQKEGFWATVRDFRPLTDCSFFVEGKKCTKGKNCPYRHSQIACVTEEVCSRWMQRKCSKLDCRFRHPGKWTTKEKSNEPQLSQADATDLVKCGGQCGDVTCAAYFARRDDLTQHIKRSRMPTCRFCGAIFLTLNEYQEHVQTCLARSGSGSTDTASQSGESVDIEVLSDTESETSLTSDLSEPGGERGHYRGNGTLTPTSASTRSKGAASMGQGGGVAAGRMLLSKTPPGTKRGSVSSTGSATNRRRKRSNSGRGIGGSSSQMEVGQAGVFVASKAEFPENGSDLGRRDSYFDYQLSDDDEEERGEDGLYMCNRAEMARLLSLNEEDMVYDSEEEVEEESEDDEEEDLKIDEGTGMDFLSKTENGHGKRIESLGQGRSVGASSENGAVKKKTSREQKKVRQKTEPHHVPGRLEPVGVFWDIENCRVPPSKSAFALASKMRAVFFEGKREAEFMCVCDVTKESKEVIDALHNAQVNLVHVNAIAKNAADDKLRHHLRRFALTYPHPSTVVLVSGDVNFSPELNDLRHIHNITVILVHNSQASDALKVFAHTLINFDEFLRDVEAPRETQHSNRPRIVLVSGLPTHIPHTKLSTRLSRISDNCGGKVISVHQPPGTARVLFRTPDWAEKAQKRMNGEDVYGQRIMTTLEHPPLPYDHAPRPGPGHMIPGPSHGPTPPATDFRRLSGPNLARTFPPAAIPTQPHPPQYSPQIERRPMHPPPQPPYPPPSAPYPLPRPPMPLSYPPPPPQSPPNPRQTPRPLLPPPPFPPTFAPPQPPQPRSLHDGKILIFKIPPVAEEEIPRLTGQVVSIRLAASVKAQETILWHDLMEMQVLLRVDFLQTAMVRREEMLQTLYKKGELRPQLAQAFIKRCADSIAEICRGENLPWDVTVCGWTEEEEEDRMTRSQVVALLRRYPNHWAKWNAFKHNYSNSYTSGISEMAIHNACKGAVQILGSPSQESTQVIVFYALSPLIRVEPSYQPMLRKNIVQLLSSQSDKKIRLLDFVQVYRKTFGGLPTSSNTRGKPLQEVLTDIPNVNLIGLKPSSIVVTLSSPGGQPHVQTRRPPMSLADIGEDFKILLSKAPNCELRLSNIQQEYQTFFHRSFRVSDFVSSEGARMRELLEVCPGIQLREVSVTGGRTDIIVGLITDQPPSASPVPLPKEAVERFRRECIKLLSGLPDRRVELGRFTTFYHKEMGVQLVLATFGAKKLNQLFQAIPDVVQLKEVTGADGKAEVYVCLEAQQLPPPTAAPLSKEAVERFKQECIKTLTGVPSRRVEMSRFPALYTREMGQQFLLATYGAKKLGQLFQAIPDIVQVHGEKDKVVELIVDSQEDCGRRIETLLYGLPNYQVSLDRFMVEYERKFGERLTSYYGHPKLISLLEDLTSFVKVTGTGPTRTISLHPVRVFACEMTQLLADQPAGLAINKIVPVYKERFQREFVLARYGFPKLIRALEAIEDIVELKGDGPSRVAHLKPQGRRGSLSVSLPSNQQFQDEITAILFSTHNLRMSVPQLTMTYNSSFRHPSHLPPVSTIQFVEALRKMPAVIKLSGAGPTQYAQLIQNSDCPSGQDQQQGARPGLLGASPLINPGSLAAMMTGPGDATGERKLLELAEKATVTEQLGENPSRAEYTPVAGHSASPGTSPSKAAATGSQVVESDTSKRLSSETHRLLLCHQEHAMTLAELVERFRASEEPAELSAEELYQCVHINNVKPGTKLTNFQISYIPASVGDSMVQLNAPDCVWKLSQDLLYLFVYQPTADFTRPLDELLNVYDKCFHHKLVPAVYQAKTVQQVMKSKQIKKFIKLDPATSICSLTDVGRQVAVAALLAELLFLNDCRSHVDLPGVYQKHFGVPLQLLCFGVDSVLSLLNQPNISAVVQLSHQLVLTTAARFAEQLRYLLTCHNGHIPLEHLESYFTHEFGKTKNLDVSKKCLLQQAPHVVNLSGLKWVIWAPTAHPYPARGSKTSPIIPRTHLSVKEGGAPVILLHDDSSEEEGKADSQVMPVGLAPEQQPQGQSAMPASPVEARESFKAAMSEPHSVEVKTDVEVAPLIDLSVEVKTDVEVAPLIDLSDDIDSEVKMSTALVSRLSESDLLVPTLAPTVPSAEEDVPVDTSPYGFLKRDLDPELLAELTSSVSQSAQVGLGGTEFQVDAFREALVESGMSSLVSFELVGDGDSEPEQAAGPSSVDYMKANMTPDEVLEELQKVKMESGGILDTESLDPFLTYFGELSSRELVRLESLEPKPRRSSSTGAIKRKRVMAIRFPGQSPPTVPDSYMEQAQKDLEAIDQKLPEAPDLTTFSDSSDDDGCLQPFVREEYMRKVLGEEASGMFGSSDEEELLGGPLGGCPAPVTFSFDTLLPPKPLSVEKSEVSMGAFQYVPEASDTMVLPMPFESSVPQQASDYNPGVQENIASMEQVNDNQ